MVQFQILSGKMAGSQWVARHFPFSVGRSNGADFSLDESAMWDRHFQIAFQPEGFVLTTEPEAFVILNGERVQRAVLKSGDLLEIGLAKIRFGLSATTQKPLSSRECVAWTGLSLLCLAEVALICWLLR
jgi:predicted component of type VI protein secretion system